MSGGTGSPARNPGRPPLPPSSSSPAPRRYRYPDDADDDRAAAGPPDLPAAATPTYSTSISTAPYRLANAAAAAASPLLGYLSGNGGGYHQHDPASAATTSSASRTRSSSNPRTAPAAAMSPSELAAAAAMAGSPAYNMPPHPMASAARTSSQQDHRRPPSDAQLRHHPNQEPTASSNVPNPGNANRTSSISDEDARKKESRNLDSIVLQFFSKAAQIITQARFTHVSTVSMGDVQDSTSRGSSSTPKRSRNRWFNLELEESDIFKDELRTWRSVTSLLATSTSTSSSSISETSSLPSDQLPLNYSNVPNMVIEVILDVSDISANQVLVLNNTREGKRFRVDLSGKGRTTHLHNPTGTIEGSPKKCNIVLERWTLCLRPPAPSGPLELPTVYKHCIILFRALYTLVRTLPIFELHRKLKRRTGRSEVKIGCRLSTEDTPTQSTSDSTSTSDTDQEGHLTRSEIALETPLGNEDDASFSILDFAFAPIVTPIGSLGLRCKYRACVDFSVEEIEALLSSRFIDEDFFKPTMRKYSTSGPGSIPLRVSGASPLQAYSRSQQRQPQAPLQGGPTIGAPAAQPQRLPVSTSPGQEDAVYEGAFVDHGKGKGPQLPSRTVSASPSELSRRPSIGGSHPFKPMSASPSQMVPRSYSTPPSEYPAGRYSASPASTGPSSSLRYAVQTTSRSPSAAGAPGPSVSQLSYTKQSIPSPTDKQPPISGLTAMHLGNSPSPSGALPGLGTQPMAVPGTTAIPLSSSPTPSLIKRYSSSRYSKSFGRDSSGSSPGEYQGFWGPESLGRRSRLSSAQSREDVQASRSRLSANAASSGDAQDADQIKSFLGMIDSRAQLPSGSLLLGGGSPGRALNRSTVLNRQNAEEKLRNLADSVMRESPGGRSASSASSQSTSGQYTRPTSTAGYAQGQMRRRSGEFVASMPTSSRQTPSPDMYSASPAEGHAVRPRISQPPMSTSIPEEDPSRHPPSSTQSQLPVRSESGSVTSGTTAGQFPFPRYVSSSMRRRGSSQSSMSRPAMPSPSASTSRGQSPDQRTRVREGSTPEVTAFSTQSQSGSGNLETSPSPLTSGGASTLSASLASQSFDGGEEQAVAQLELGVDSTEDVHRYDRHRLPEPPRDYRLGRPN